MTSPKNSETFDRLFNKYYVNPDTALPAKKYSGGTIESRVIEQGILFMSFVETSESENRKLVIFSLLGIIVIEEAMGGNERSYLLSWSFGDMLRSTIVNINRLAGGAIGNAPFPTASKDQHISLSEKTLEWIEKHLETTVLFCAGSSSEEPERRERVNGLFRSLMVSLDDYHEAILKALHY